MGAALEAYGATLLDVSGTPGRPVETREVGEVATRLHHRASGRPLADELPDLLPDYVGLSEQEVSAALGLDQACVRDQG
jgi:hypothetical protein